MPLVRITYPRGALASTQKRQLAARLTEIVLDAEVDAVTESGRMVTVVQFQEVAADDWAVGGELRSPAAGAPDHFIVDVIVLEGLLEGERRTAVHRRVTEAFQAAFGDDGGDPTRILRVWVLVHEVREGSWGAAGRTVSALDVAQFINPDLPGARQQEILAKVAPERLSA
jgi:phenylpyruvate tautomerase PptA (4-oxalocrotonate tautomerase family)